MKTPLQNWVDEQIKLMQPDKVFWMDGSEEEGRIKRNFQEHIGIGLIQMMLLGLSN